MSMFLRCAFEKWSHAFCLAAAAKMLMICSTLGLAREEGGIGEEGKGEEEVGYREYEWKGRGGEEGGEMLRYGGGREGAGGRGVGRRMREGAGR